MSHFTRQGNIFQVSPEKSLDIQKTLPVSNYLIRADQYGNFFLEMTDSFPPSGKVYGNVTQHTQRILSTFTHRNKSTGVMLTGEKGSGKTLLAKNISNVAAEEGIPTIIINQPWRGDKFNKFLQDISQPCIVLFDEFEKVYDLEEQEEVLTLFDGVYPSNKLFIVTCNNMQRVDENIRNRPGRMFYSIDFAGLDEQFIREYCKDNLKAKKHTNRICELAGLFSKFNFDMIKAIVEEMNRYNETPEEALVLLNAKPSYSGKTSYDIEVIIPGKKIKKVYPPNMEVNIMGSDTIQISYQIDSKDKDDDDKDYEAYLSFSSEDIDKIDPKLGIVIYKLDKLTVKFTKKKTHEYNYLAM